MQARYRQDYIGEYIIPSINIVNGRKEELRQWVANKISVTPVQTALCSINGTTANIRTYRVVDDLIEVNYDQIAIYSTELNPQEHLLVPYNPRLTTSATAVYLAAFDQTKEIFLAGYNDDKSIWRVIKAYPGILFTFIGDVVLLEANSRSITQQEFIEQYSAVV